MTGYPHTLSLCVSLLRHLPRMSRYVPGGEGVAERLRDITDGAGNRRFE